MAYLTLVNSFDEDSSRICERLGTACNPYDFAIVSDNPSPILDRLGRTASSSITIQSPSTDLHLAKRTMLGIARDDVPGEQWDGVYNRVLTGSEVDDIYGNLSGFLELALDDDINHVGRGDVPLSGKDYVAKPKGIPTQEEIKAYHKGTQALTELIAEYMPTMVYAPVRGAHPIAASALLQGDGPVRIYFPVTSSFVIQGRANHLREVKRLQKSDHAERLLYAEETVSGGTLRGHLRELQNGLSKQIATGEVEISSFGLVHADGTKFNHGLDKYFDPLIEAGELTLKPVPNLYTLDDNVQSGLHYVNYGIGPHCVPFNHKI